MSNSNPSDGKREQPAPSAEPMIERLIFNNRLPLLIVFLVLTLFLGYNAAKIQPDASFERLIPLEHPYIVNMMEHRDDLQNLGNYIRIAVENEDGDIFDKEYMDTLEKITDEVFYLQTRGLDEAQAKGLIVSGFVDPITSQLPLPYALELNRLIRLEIEGTLG